MIRASLHAAACAAALVSLAGCARPLHRRAATAPAAERPEGAALVFAPADADDADLAGRRDALLSARAEPGPLTAAGEWPLDPRPTMERPLRVFLSSSERHQLFFRTERPRPASCWPSP